MGMRTEKKESQVSPKAEKKKVTFTTSMEFEKVLYKRKAGSASARVTTCSAKAEHVQRDNALDFGAGPYLDTLAPSGESLKERLPYLGAGPSLNTLALVRNSLKDESLIEKACSTLKDLGESLIAGP
ncbi:hypothetical protein ACHWQZ_G016831 [Mnemiopsis leidyi]